MDGDVTTATGVAVVGACPRAGVRFGCPVRLEGPFVSEAGARLPVFAGFASLYRSPIVLPLPISMSLVFSSVTSSALTMCGVIAKTISLS